MLGFRKDFGFSGMAEPEDFITLVQLILQEGLFGWSLILFLVVVLAMTCLVC